MNILQAIIMGIVQGLSEFLPISSSAHLVISSNLYKFFTGMDISEQSTQEVFLDIMLHLGTLVAVLIYFRKEIWTIIKALFKGIKTRDFSDKNAKTGLYILIGTFITIAVALPLGNLAESLIFKPEIVGLLLIGTAILLFSSEAFSKKLAEKSDNVDFKTSMIMAIAQGIAALPGFSRSGLTIAAGLFCKRDRVSSSKYSFLLSIPIILGASMVYPMFKVDVSEFGAFNWSAIIIGTIVSAIVGYLCVKYFLKFVAKYSLAFFAYYCLIAGLFTSVFFFIVTMGL